WCATLCPRDAKISGDGLAVAGAPVSAFCYGCVRAGGASAIAAGDPAARGRPWGAVAQGAVASVRVVRPGLRASDGITLLCVCSFAGAGRLTSSPHLQQHPWCTD